MILLYKCLLNVAYLLLWPLWIIKGLKNRREWSLRRGLQLDKYLNFDDKKKRRFWAHASSMGEVRVLHKLMTELQSHSPEIDFCISTYTRTGQELAGKLFSDLNVFYFPLDAALPLRRYFKYIKPDGIILVETEIWPYFMDFCNRLDIPVIVANGRLSEKSGRQYGKFRKSLARLMKCYRKFAVQTENDKEKFINIGADPGKIIVTGNVKNDVIDFEGRDHKRNGLRQNLDLSPEEIFVIFASTRQGEELMILRALNDLEVFPEKMRVMIAPRHLKRLDEVKTELDAHAIEYVLYSENIDEEKYSRRLILMDKMGFLAELFYAADLAFVGGTLAPLGGHNIMEPVLAGTPVFFGPSLDNVKEAAALILDRELGRMIQNESEIATLLNDFIAGRIHFDMKNPRPGSSLSAAEKTAKLIIEEFDL